MTGAGAIALGGAVLTTVGIVVGALALPHQPPVWILVALVLVILTGLGLTTWGALRLRPERATPRPTRFISGDVNDSYFEDVLSEADTFADRDVSRSVFRRTEHRPKHRR